MPNGATRSAWPCSSRDSGEWVLLLLLLPWLLLLAPLPSSGTSGGGGGSGRPPAGPPASESGGEEPSELAPESPSSDARPPTPRWLAAPRYCEYEYSIIERVRDECANTPFPMSTRRGLAERLRQRPPQAYTSPLPLIA